MSIDDLIYGPIVPTDELRDLVKKIMRDPTNRKILDAVSDHIVDLFGKHGIHDEQEIVDAVYRAIKDVEGLSALVSVNKRGLSPSVIPCGKESPTL